MATIQFKAKLQTMYTMDDDIAYQFVAVPVLKHNHCDMGAFRSHPRHGGLANSNMFLSVLERIRSDTFTNNMIKMHEIPDGVTVDTSKFLAKITFEV